MTNKIKLLFVFLLIATTGFSQDVVDAAKGVNYGEKTTAKGAFPVSQLATKMGNQETMNAKVTGKVVDVCTKKGCWMKVENANGETTRVTFKDYGFFMPKNIVGKYVVLDGISSVKTTSVKDLQHYAEDAGKSKEEIAKIKSPKKEITFEAKGVLVL